MSAIKSEEAKEWGVPEEVPTLTELKKQLPPHCFKPSLILSFYFLAKDLVLVAFLYVLLLALENQPYRLVYYAFLPIYWFLQSVMFTALFVIGHDCGHESFSGNNLINDTVGTILHSALLVPYYPWKLSHRRHHKNTCNIDKDEHFFPVREKQMKSGEVSEFSDFLPYFGLGLGWAVYFVKGYAPRNMQHFNPWDPLLAPYAFQCIISVLGILAWVAFGLVPYAMHMGVVKLISHYFIPILGYAGLNIAIIFLHHTNENVPWYSDEKWDYMRGQLSTVDRFYGYPWHYLIHNIGTHQVHHLFTKIPHYHLEEATHVFREKYPDLARESKESIFGAFFRLYWVFISESVIPDEAHFHTYRGEHGKVN